MHSKTILFKSTPPILQNIPSQHHTKRLIFIFLLPKTHLNPCKSHQPSCPISLTHQLFLLATTPFLAVRKHTLKPCINHQPDTHFLSFINHLPPTPIGLTFLTSLTHTTTTRFPLPPPPLLITTINGHTTTTTTIFTSKLA